jgi:elongation factor 2 kinase
MGCFAGDEYTKTSPPKKVDVMQAAVLEFRDRPDRPLYCVEHMIEGDYVSDKSTVNCLQGLICMHPSSCCLPCRGTA